MQAGVKIASTQARVKVQACKQEYRRKSARQVLGLGSQHNVSSCLAIDSAHRQAQSTGSCPDAMCNCNAQGLANMGWGDEGGTAVTHLVDIGLDEL
jgi:hypothetical protein